MAELECRMNAARELGKKFRQQLRIGFQIRRQLEQYRPHLFRPCQRFDGAQKANHKISRSFKTLDVSDDLVRLHRKAETRRRLRNPFLNSCLLHQLPESEVDLNSVELSCVILQEILLGKFGRIKLWLPAGISPS